MSELSIVILLSAVLFSVVFIVVFWKLGKDVGKLGKDISRKKQLYLDCLMWYKKNPKEVTSEDVEECKTLLEKKIGRREI